MLNFVPGLCLSRRTKTTITRRGWIPPHQSSAHSQLGLKSALVVQGNKLQHDREEISPNTLQHYFLSAKLLLLLKLLATGATTINTFEHFEGAASAAGAADSIVH